jgi:predicted O-methyltransferase YrrM
MVKEKAKNTAQFIFRLVFSANAWQQTVKNPPYFFCFVQGIVRHPLLFSQTRKIDGLISPYIGAELYDTVMKSKHPSKNVIEVGAYKGLSTIHLATACRKVNKRVKSFEIFSGLPEIDSTLDKGFNKGDFSSDVNTYENNLKSCNVRDMVDLTIGDARQTMSAVLKDHGFAVAFLDVDLYEIMKDLMLQLIPICRGGEVLVIHDTDHDGVRKAVNEIHILTGHTIKEKRLEGGASVKLEIPLNFINHKTKKYY